MMAAPVTLAFVAAGLLALAGWPGGPRPLLVNESHSLPRGLYVRRGDPVAPGRVVALRAPPAGRAYLATLGAGPQARLLKRVAALGGARVCARAGRLAWPGGVVVAETRDGRGRRLPVWRGCRRLAANELLVLGDTPRSFDSRYFGPVPRSDVDGVYAEVLGW